MHPRVVEFVVHLFRCVSIRTGLTCFFSLSLYNNSQANHCCRITVRVWEMYYVEPPIKKKKKKRAMLPLGNNALCEYSLHSSGDLL